LSHKQLVLATWVMLNNVFWLTHDMTDCSKSSICVQMYLSLNALTHTVMSKARSKQSNDRRCSGAVVEAEELGPCPDNACQHESEADQITSCLHTMMMAAEVMIGTLPDASQSSTGPTTVRASQQRRGAKSRQSSALLPAAEERLQVSSSTSTDGLCSTILRAVG